MADETSGETKPKVESDVIQLLVKDQSGGEVHFKVKTKTKFEKIMNAFCAKKSLEMSAVRFLFDGQRLNPQQTPADHGMEDNDVIDCAPCSILL